MVNILAEQMTLLAAGTTPAPGFVGGTVRVFNEQVTLAAQAVADTIEVGKLPKGAVPLYGVIVSSVSLATSTVAIGISGTAGKYRTAAALTATTPEMFGASGGVGEALAVEETVIATVGTLAFPAAGTLRVMLFYAFD